MIVCNELRLLIRHRAVRKDTHAGLQRLPSADVPSCSQKRHTRWPATNSGCWCAIVRSEKTHTLACNEFQVLMCHRAVRERPRDALACKELPMLRHRSAVGKQTVTHQLWRTKSGDSNNLPLLFDATRLLVALPFLQSTETTQHRVQQGQQNRKKGSQY